MKVLLVDDDKKIATAIRRGLEAEGFTVELSSDGDDGLWRATEGSYDLVILDVLLPRRNGYLVCAELRRLGKWMPILMLTAKDGELDEAEGLDTGADDYLVKPFSFAVLLARMRALLRRTATTERATTVVGDLRMDSTGRRVWLHDREIAVTTREFDVLEYLIRRCGRVVSKTEILNGVWTDDFDGDANIVEVYVGRLRHKLIDGGIGGPVIATVRGAGYRIETS